MFLLRIVPRSVLNSVKNASLTWRIVRCSSRTRMQSETKFNIAMSGTRREGKNTFAGPKEIISTCPEIRRISRYFATEFRLVLILRAMSVTVIPFGFSRRIDLIWSSSSW